MSRRSLFGLLLLPLAPKPTAQQWPDLKECYRFSSKYGLPITRWIELHGIEYDSKDFASVEGVNGDVHQS